MVGAFSRSQDILNSRPFVLFAVFQTGNSANGGVESVSALIEGLPSWSRTILTNLETPVCARWRRSGARVVVRTLPYRLSSGFFSGGVRGVLSRLWSLVESNVWVMRQGRRLGCNLIHCNDPAPFLHIIFGARLTRTPVLLNLRDTKSTAERLDAGRYRWRFARCAGVLLLSREMREFYERVYAERPEGYRPVMEFIYSIVDLLRLRPLAAGPRETLRRELGIAPDEIALGYVAAFNDKKNQLDYLAQALPLLAQQVPEARTHFIGDFRPDADPYARRCLELVEFTGFRSRVSFVGYTTKVEDWYQACDLVLVPTRQEGLARCMIEAMACAVPVVSFDVCSAREMLETRDCGNVVPQGNYSALVEAIKTLALDSELRQKQGKNGRQTAEELFNVNAALEKYKTLLEGILKRRAGPFHHAESASK